MSPRSLGKEPTHRHRVKKNVVPVFMVYRSILTKNMFPFLSSLLLPLLGATQEKPLSASKTRNGENAYPIDSSEPLCTNLKNPLSSSNAVRGTTNDSGHSYSPGYASGASTPTDSRSLDGSQHGGNRDRANSYNNPKALSHSGSVLGLDSMIEARREEGALSSNVVHIEVSPFEYQRARTIITNVTETSLRLGSFRKTN